MCSRYDLDRSAASLTARFRLGRPPPAVPDGLRRPTDPALVVEWDGQGNRQAVVLRWGIRASWDSKPLINARAETLRERKTFRPLLMKRCLVPATGYFEWQGTGTRRIKYRIVPAEMDGFAFAGLRDGDSFVIVTCAPASAISHIYDRMPVILDPTAEGDWIDSDKPFADVAPLLVPYRAGPLLATTDSVAAAQGDLFG